MLTATATERSGENNRDVVWSGACSSGGQRRKTCVFTLNADAVVTAEVR